MPEEKCLRCNHSRRSHSRDGCIEIVDMRTGKECSCRVKYMDKLVFVVGTPKVG